jgi:serine/threonine protein kinase
MHYSESDAGAPVTCVKCGAVLNVPTVAELPANVLDPQTVAPDAPVTPAPDTEPHAEGRSTDFAKAAYAFLAPAQAPDELGRLGPYRVLKVLGHGGMGIVFVAQDTRLGRQVAIKAMLPQLAVKPDARERFLREAKTAAAIEHDNIVTILQVDEDRGVPYIAMPLLRGTTLESWLRAHEGQTLPLPVILKLGKQIAQGLAAAHAVGLVHRDIKPANIFLQATVVDPSGRGTLVPTSPLAGDFRAKILDFGLARPSAGEQNLTQSGMILGTPAYMAPEQARRGGKVSHRTDLFSLGVVLYRLCTGRLPFLGDDMMSTLMATATEEPVPPRDINPNLPPSLSGMVLRLLSKDAEQRPASADEVVERIEALEAWLADAATTPPPLDQPTVFPVVSRAAATQTMPLYAAVPVPIDPEQEGPRTRRRDAQDDDRHPRRERRNDLDISIPPRGPSGVASVMSFVVGLVSFVVTTGATLLGLLLGVNCVCAVMGGYAGLAAGAVLALAAIVLGMIGLQQGARPYARMGIASAGISLVMIIVYIVLMVTLGPEFFGAPNNLFGPRPAPRRQANANFNALPPKKDPGGNMAFAKDDPALAVAQRIQGEYVGNGKGGRVGCQVIALGLGQLQAVVLPGGLPGPGWGGMNLLGAGWDGKNKSLLQGQIVLDRAVFGPAAGNRKYLAQDPINFSATSTFPPVGQENLTALIDGDTITINHDGQSFMLHRIVRKCPTLGQQPPADAVVLFDGKTTNEWDGGRIEQGEILNTDGKDIRTKRRFNNYSVHLEFMLPFRPEARGQGRANSGFYQVMQYEVQILDSFGLDGKKNECGAIYEAVAPSVNMCLPPLQWQTYDIDFTNAVPDQANSKKVAKRARITCKHNGVVILDNVEIPGPTGGHWNEPEGTAGPLLLQGQGNPMHFRNIWVVEKK